MAFPPLSIPWARTSGDPQTVGRRIRLLVEEAPHLPASARVLQVPQRVDLRSSPATFGRLRLGLDLPDPLPRRRKLLSDLLERVVGVHADAEAHLYMYDAGPGDWLPPRLRASARTPGSLTRAVTFRDRVRGFAAPAKDIAAARGPQR